jgi:hypothetical protein
MSVPTKELKFIHITKTAGSSIETVGLEKNKRWGIHHKEYGFWHEIFSNKPNSLKSKYDWFMVVRNPYNRIISEYNFIANSLGLENHTVDEFNRFIKRWMLNASNNKENHPMYGRINGDHFTEQYKYYDPSVIIHILKFENITEEFNNLMKKYNYDIILNKKVQVSKIYFNLKDISNENIELIKTIYKNDFEIFGYSTDINDYLKITKTIIPGDYEIKKILKYIPISRNANKYIMDITKKLSVKWAEDQGDYGWKFEKFINKSKDLKSKYDWFMVVRNPYTRILSEYAFLKSTVYLNCNHNVKDFNRIINKWINNISNNAENHPKYGRKIGDHFTEQYKYYDSDYKIHLVKYENLQEELNTILKMYNYSHISEEYIVENKFPYSIDDINQENISLINSVYKKDFELFGYETIGVDSPVILLKTELEDNKHTIQKQLKYIHITRTAGTSIEQTGLDSKLFWGRYDISYGIFDEPFILKSDNLKNKYDWFTIVRNPYTRILSEYNYLKVVLRIKNADDPIIFNNYLDKWLSIIKNSGKIHGHHLIQQHKYLDSNYAINILKYENLIEDFNKLMAKYEYSIVLNKKVSVSNSVLNIENITPANILLIKTVYKKDFEDFGYASEYIP